MGPLCEKMPVSRAFSTYPSGPPARKPCHQVPFTELPQRETPNLQSPLILLSKSLVDEPSSRFPKWGPYGKRCPSPEPFLHIFQGPQQVSQSSWLMGPHRVISICPSLEPSSHILLNPQKGAPLTELPQREMLPIWSPPKILSQQLHKFPNRPLK